MVNVNHPGFGIFISDLDAKFMNQLTSECHVFFFLGGGGGNFLKGQPPPPKKKRNNKVKSVV